MDEEGNDDDEDEEDVFETRTITRINGNWTTTRIKITTIKRAKRR